MSSRRVNGNVDYPIKDCEPGMKCFQYFFSLGVRGNQYIKLGFPKPKEKGKRKEEYQQSRPKAQGRHSNNDFSAVNCSFALCKHTKFD